MHQLVSWGMVLLFAAAPSSTNYTLKSYDVGGSGSSSSSSTNYKLNATTGSQSGSSGSSTNYSNPQGLQNADNANVPPAPTFTNPSNYYDKLKLILATGSNPSDTKYLIAISSDGFSTTNYVQSDNSVGSSQAITNYQTYAAWGGASGILVTGLLPSTTYQVKVKALQGTFTGSSFGPTASAATVAPSLTAGLSTTLTSSPPFPVGFTSLTPGSVVSGDADIIVQLTSNANAGGAVYVQSANGALTSSLAGSSIPSATADLSSVSSGYGAQIISASQSAGGPFTAQSPFDGSSNNVGALPTVLQVLLSTTGPITSGSATVRLKARASSISPSATDYGDTLTLVTAMTF